MKFFTVITGALILGVASIGTALAQPADQDHLGCSHEATIASVRTCVVHFVDNGSIDNQGVVWSLLAKLDAADGAVARGQQAVAIHQLKAMSYELNAQAGNHIAQPHADHLAQHVKMVIAALQQ